MRASVDVPPPPLPPTVMGMQALSEEDEGGVTLFELSSHLSRLWGRDPHFSSYILRLLSQQWLEYHPDPESRKEEGGSGQWRYTAEECDRAALLRVRPALASAFLLRWRREAGTCSKEGNGTAAPSHA